MMFMSVQICFFVNIALEKTFQIGEECYFNLGAVAREKPTIGACAIIGMGLWYCMMWTVTQSWLAILLAFCVRTRRGRCSSADTEPGKDAKYHEY